MKITLTLNDFRDEINKYSDIYKNQFSYEGQEALYNYLTDYEEGTGEELEFDLVAFCCDFTEYNNFKDFESNYKYFDNIKNINELKENTEVIKIKGTDGFIIKNF